MIIGRSTHRSVLCCAGAAMAAALVGGAWSGAVAEEGAPPLLLKGHEADLAGAVFSPDGSKVVTASYDGIARIWDVGAAGAGRH